MRPYSWYSSPSTYDKRHGTRVEKTPLRVPKSNGTLDTATLAKIMQGWRILPLGYQNNSGTPADGSAPSLHPPEWPVRSGTIGDSRRFLQPTRPPARTARAQRVHQRLQPISSTLSTVRMWTRHTNMCLSEHIVWCPKNKTPATQQSIVQHPTSQQQAAKHLPW